MRLVIATWMLALAIGLAGASSADEPGLCSGLFRTQSQGGWGAPAAGHNPGTYRDAHFGTAFPSGLTIGADAVGVAGPSAHFTSAAAVREFLPQGGRPASLGGDAVDPTSTSAGVLGGQVLALALSVGFDAADPVFGESCIPLAELVVVDPASACVGYTVGEALDEANRVLAGVSGPLGASHMNDCISRINENFVDGASDLGGLAIADPAAGDFRTHDQLAWGQSAAEGSAGAYRDANFALAFPSGVSVGADALGIAGFSAHFTSASAVEAFLPQAGPAGPLAADAVDPLATDAGALAGDTLALALNVGFDAFDPSFGASCVPLAELVVADPASPCLGQNVEQILAQANTVLAGAGIALTAEEIGACVASVNADFLGGTVAGGFLEYPVACAGSGGGENLVEECSLAVNFRRPGRDRFKLEGELALPAGFEPGGQTAQCGVGGASVAFTLNARGAAKTTQGKFRVKPDRKTGAWRYVCQGQRGDWQDDWADDGLANADVRAQSAALPVEVSVGGVSSGAMVPVDYSAKADRAGKAKR